MTEQEKEFMEELQKEVETLRVELAYAREQVNQLLRHSFGRSKETVKEENPDQLSLFEEDCQALPPSAPEEVIVVHRRKKKRKGHKAELLKDLPAQEVHYELIGEDCQCPKCQEDLKEIGRKLIREEPIFFPARLEKKQHIQHRYCCPHCEQAGETNIFEAKVPRALLPHSLASASLVTEIITQKFDLHLPLHRQEKEWKEMGLSLSRRTISHWLIRVCDYYLKPLTDLFKQHLLKQPAIHADETTYRMTDSQQFKNYFWLFRSIEQEKHPVVYYAFDESRGQKALDRILPEGYQGYLHCDGYSTYNKLTESIQVGCFAHLRRYFFEALPSEKELRNESPAMEGVRWCNALFKEDEVIRKECETFEQIHAKRKERLEPLLKSFREWADRVNAASQSKFGKALTYLRNQWKHLNNVLKDGRLALSNNLAERSIRPVVLGRKNYLFSSCAEGAHANAVYYTIVETAKANGLNVRSYLKHLLTCLPQIDFLTEEALSEFLPWHPTVQLAYQQTAK